MMTTGEAIGVLRAIEFKVMETNNPSPVARLDILKYIRSYIDLIQKYDGIPRIQDMYPTMHVTMWEDTDAVPTDPDDYLKREV